MQQIRQLIREELSILSEGTSPLNKEAILAANILELLEANDAVKVKNKEQAIQVIYEGLHKVGPGGDTDAANEYEPNLARILKLSGHSSAKRKKGELRFDDLLDL